MTELSSRERMLRTLNFQEADRIPCCFMSFTALRKRHKEDLYELAKAERAMGLDSMLFIPSLSRPQRPDHPDLRGLPVRFDERVRTREWRDGDVLHKEYTTPAGALTTQVRLSEDWTHGEHIPFVDDFQVPRMLKPLIAGPQDLEALKFMLTSPAQAEIASYQQEVQKARAFVQQHGVLLAGGWGVGMDMVDWLCGMESVMVMSMEQPELIAELLRMINAWVLKRMEVVLSAPVDLYIRRAWYEGCDFVTPEFYRQAILPGLKAETALAHARGAKFGYICTSGTLPMLDLFMEAGIDVLIGVDPVQGTHTDMAAMKKKADGRMCLWGGVSAAVTVERGEEQDVRAAVRQAVATLGPRGFILSPIDNITVDAPRTWRNIETFIDAWRNGSRRQALVVNS